MQNNDHVIERDLFFALADRDSANDHIIAYYVTRWAVASINRIIAKGD